MALPFPASDEGLRRWRGSNEDESAVWAAVCGRIWTDTLGRAGFLHPAYARNLPQRGSQHVIALGRGGWVVVCLSVRH